MPSLTSHLLKLDQASLHKATTHPFLQAAATSSLPLPKLKLWLAQDRLYALSYVNFIGTLLSQLSLPAGSDRESTLEWRVADCLIDCLGMIRSELKLFEDAATASNLLEEICNVPAERPTRCYQDLFAASLSQGRPLLIGLVILWASEECYLLAWKHARSQLEHSLGAREKDIMQRVFIPNWTSPEFEALVRRLGALVNKMCMEWGVEEGGWVWKECEAAWRQVLWCEGEFWPDV